MENIEISKRLLKIAKSDWFCYGVESYIYRIDRNSIYKIFRTDRKDVLENKLSKLIKLDKLGIEFLTNPTATLSYKGNFIGYRMNYDEDNMRWFDTFLTIEETKKYLKLLKERLLVLEEYGILYPDINAWNLLINAKNGELSFCDNDNVQIGGLKVDVVQCISKCLQGKNSLFDNSIHAFMHNIYTLEQLEVEVGYIYDLSSLIGLDGVKTFSSFNENQERVLKNMIMVKKKDIRNSYLIDNLR